MYSPPPWTVISTSEDDFLQIKAQPLHARGFSQRIATMERGLDDKQCVANAYLIKEAPRMFELLQDVLKQERITSEMHKRIADVILRASTIKVSA
jgi:hypothetical protein